jgi:GGDEF domain-containing protein
MFGTAMMQVMASYDCALRYGVEEVLKLLPDVAANQTFERAERMCEHIAGQRLCFEGHDLGPLAVLPA